MKKILNRKTKLTSFLKFASHGDTHHAIQKEIFDVLVENGLSEKWAAMVVSNIGYSDLILLNKKIKKEYRPEYGWQHSCGESYHQLDNPGDTCPSCGEEGGDWEWFDRTIEKEG